MWCHQPSPGGQELCVPRESARITHGPLSYPVPSQEAHLEVHQDVLELESPVQVQLQRHRVHVWKDKKEERQARDSPVWESLRSQKKALDAPGSLTSLSGRNGTSPFLLILSVQHPECVWPDFLPTVTCCP